MKDLAPRRILGPLFTERLVLRTLSSRDLPAFEKLYRDRRVWVYIPRGVWRRGGRAAYARIRRLIRGRTAYAYAIAERQTGAFVGQIELFSINWVERTAALGYCIARSQWNQGYATEAAHRLCELAFHRLRLRRLDAVVGEGNDASVAILRKLGFRAEGSARKAAWLQGRWRDADKFGLLASEYRPG
jgi:RimJ/RimL family protein N-acetyltransferase